jgi:hypothetical protein
MSWVVKDWVIYYIELQVVAFLAVLAARNHRIALLIVFEAFINSSTQDLIFYGLWGLGSFPTENWSWMIWYQLFGTWTTPMQVSYSAIALSLSSVIAYFLPHKVGKQKIP